MIKSGILAPDKFIVLIPELNISSRLKSSVCLAGGATVDPDRIDRITLKLLLGSISQSLSRPQQNDQHKYSPGHTERSEEGPQFICADGGEYFGPDFPVEHERFKV